MAGVVKGIGGAIGKVAKFAGPLISGINPLIGAGLGAIGGVLSRPGEDPRYAGQEQYLQQLQGAGAPQTAGINPMSAQAFGLLQKYATQGSNPFEEQVIGGMQRDTARAGQLGLNYADDMATRSGAFGGSRHGLFAGKVLGDVNRAGLDRMAAYRSQNFDTQNQFGLQSAHALAQAGDYSRGIQQQGYDAPFNRLAQLGPLYAGQLQAGQGYQKRPSIFNAALGGAIAGYGAFKKKPPAPNIWSQIPRGF